MLFFMLCLFLLLTSRFTFSMSGVECLFFYVSFPVSQSFFSDDWERKWNLQNHSLFEQTVGYLLLFICFIHVITCWLHNAFEPLGRSRPPGIPVLCNPEKWCPRGGRGTEAGFLGWPPHWLLSEELGTPSLAPLLHCGAPADGVYFKRKYKKYINITEFCVTWELNLRFKVVQHDDVGSGGRRLSTLGCGLTLHLDLTAEAAHWPRHLHRLTNKNPQNLVAENNKISVFCSLNCCNFSTVNTT